MGLASGWQEQARLVGATLGTCSVGGWDRVVTASIPMAFPAGAMQLPMSSLSHSA